MANLFKFSHGGWFTILIAGVVALTMIVWRKATEIRGTFVEYRCLADYAGIITDLKNDKEIPEYSSNVVYFSRSRKRGEVESKLMYSIINKEPKRADHYFIINPEYADDPYTLEYDVDIIVPDTMYEIKVRMGFKVEPKITVYLRHIVEDLVADGKMNLTSSYPSLRKRGIPGNFKFIILHRIFSPSSTCGKTASMLMKCHALIRKISISDEKAMGLDTSNVVVETVPLIINTSDARRIARSENGWTDNGQDLAGK